MFVNRLGQSGRHVVLPSTYRGSPRDNVQRYGDSMAIVRSIGKPHIFMTVTTNPKWEEIVSALPSGRAAHHCPWICVRVFKQKFDLLLDDILKKDVFGKARLILHVVFTRVHTHTRTHIDMYIYILYPRIYNTCQHDRFLGIRMS